MTRLFDSCRLGDPRLPNRVVTAPMTRVRATPEGPATPSMATYYAQRATAGLIVSEGCSRARSDSDLAVPLVERQCAHRPLRRFGDQPDPVRRRGGVRDRRGRRRGEDRYPPLPGRDVPGRGGDRRPRALRRAAGRVGPAGGGLRPHRGHRRRRGAGRSAPGLAGGPRDEPRGPDGPEADRAGRGRPPARAGRRSHRLRPRLHRRPRPGRAAAHQPPDGAPRRSHLPREATRGT